MIKNIVVPGGGTAGFTAALTLKRKLPALNVRVVRSPDIGIIGVGEGTNMTFPAHLLDTLQGVERIAQLHPSRPGPINLRNRNARHGGRI